MFSTINVKTVFKEEDGGDDNGSDDYKIQVFEGVIKVFDFLIKFYMYSNVNGSSFFVKI